MHDYTQTEGGNLRVLAPAKINLFLHILRKRPDGYHDLCSLMCPVTLFDTVELRFSRPETGQCPTIEIVCDHPDIAAGIPPDVPIDETNLAWRAAALFLSRLNANENLRIRLEKRIPAAAGLGGGSSDAAAVLTALNRRFSFPFSQATLMEMGRRLGADVPFFILNRPAIARGIGERLTVYEDIRPFFLVLVAFSFGVSTADVYKNLNLGLTNCKKDNTSSALENRQDFDIPRHLCNDLETVTIPMFPEIEAAKRTLLGHGATGALMSGSGPTVFGLFNTAEERNRAFLSLSNSSTSTPGASSKPEKPTSEKLRSEGLKSEGLASDDQIRNWKVYSAELIGQPNRDS